MSLQCDAHCFREIQAKVSQRARIDKGKSMYYSQLCYELPIKHNGKHKLDVN